MKWLSIMSFMWENPFPKFGKAPPNHFTHGLHGFRACLISIIYTANRHSFCLMFLTAQQVNCEKVHSALMHSALHRHSITMKPQRDHGAFRATPGFAHSSQFLALDTAWFRHCFFHCTCLVHIIRDPFMWKQERTVYFLHLFVASILARDLCPIQVSPHCTGL